MKEFKNFKVASFAKTCLIKMLKFKHKFEIISMTYTFLKQFYIDNTCS